MRILFDGYWWGSDPANNRFVQRELILAWRAAFPTDQVAVALRSDVQPVGLPVGIEAMHTHLRPHALANMFELGRIGTRWHADVVVADDFTPLRDGGVTIMHDVSFLDHPQWLTATQRMYLAPILANARFARVVATSTQSEAERIERHSWPLAPVTAIGIAPRTPITAAEPQRPHIAAGLDGFALTVGRLGGRANVEAAIAAAEHSARITPRTPLIVVAGIGERANAARQPSWVRRLRDAGLVRFAGRVSDSGMSWLYRHASVCLATAHDESMGLPALEATWFDTPLVAADLPAHRELVAGWARFVPTDISAADLARETDAHWDAPGDEDARTRILERRTWSAVARSLRAVTTVA